MFGALSIEFFAVTPTDFSVYDVMQINPDSFELRSKKVLKINWIISFRREFPHPLIMLN